MALHRLFLYPAPSRGAEACSWGPAPLFPAARLPTQGWPWASAAPALCRQRLGAGSGDSHQLPGSPCAQSLRQQAEVRCGTLRSRSAFLRGPQARLGDPRPSLTARASACRQQHPAPRITLLLQTLLWPGQPYPLQLHLSSTWSPAGCPSLPRGSQEGNWKRLLTCIPPNMRGMGTPALHHLGAMPPTPHSPPAPEVQLSLGHGYHQPSCFAPEPGHESWGMARPFSPTGHLQLLIPHIKPSTNPAPPKPAHCCLWPRPPGHCLVSFLVSWP